MKKVLLNLVILFSLALVFNSCTKRVVTVQNLEINTSKVLNLGKINQNTTTLIGSYAVYNPTQEMRTVYGLKIQFINYYGLIDNICYKLTDSPNWISVPLINDGVVNIIFKRSLRMNESTQFAQIRIHTTSFGNITTPLIVSVKAHSIDSERGSIIPKANSVISFAVGG